MAVLGPPRRVCVGSFIRYVQSSHVYPLSASARMCVHRSMRSLLRAGEVCMQVRAHVMLAGPSEQPLGLERSCGHGRQRTEA